MLIYVNNIDTNIFKKFSFYYNFILIYVNITDRQTGNSKVISINLNKYSILFKIDL